MALQNTVSLGMQDRGMTLDAAAAPPRRVLFLITTLGQGGTERNLVAFCRHIDRRRFLPEVWYLQDTQPNLLPQLQATGVPIRCLHRPASRDLRFAWRLIRQLSSVPADLIHVFLPTVAYYAVLAKRLGYCRVPMVFSAGGAHTELPLEKQLFKYGIGRSCDPILCNSPAVFDYLKKLGVPEQRMRVIPNAHDPSPFEVPLDRDAVRARQGVKSGELVLITVGRLIESKRQRDLIEAVAALRQRGYPVVLWVVGEGVLRGELEEAARGMGIDHAVVFLGARNDVPDLLRAADQFVFASATEGLPNAVIEAALAGCPIVASRIGGVEAIVDDNRSALLFPVGDVAALVARIEELLQESARATGLASAAAADARAKFSLEATLQLLYRAYDAALSPPAC